MTLSRLWPRPVIAIRIAFVLAGIIMTSTLANPGADLIEHYHSYYLWRGIGTTHEWAVRSTAVMLFECIALVPLGKPSVYIRAGSSVIQTLWYAGLGLTFALTQPPQTGSTYFAFALLALYLAAETIRDGR